MTSSLYEAVALGLRAIRETGFAGELPSYLDEVSVTVASVRVEHKVQMKKFNEWLGRTLKVGGADGKVTALLDNVRTLHRNPLMHPDDWLSEDEAVELFCICQTALRVIIVDMEAKNLLPTA
jgi:hypothetical protein